MSQTELELWRTAREGSTPLKGERRTPTNLPPLRVTPHYTRPVTVNVSEEFPLRDGETLYIRSGKGYGDVIERVKVQFVEREGKRQTGYCEWEVL